MSQESVLMELKRVYPRWVTSDWLARRLGLGKSSVSTNLKRLNGKGTRCVERGLEVIRCKREGNSFTKKFKVGSYLRAVPVYRYWK